MELTTKLHEVNLAEYRNLILKHKKRFAINIGVAAVAAIVVAFSIPRQYKAEVKLAPEVQNSSLAGNLSSLASMVGVKMNGSSEDAIQPELYPDVKSSSTFLADLFDVKIRTLDGSINKPYRNYIIEDTKVAWWSLPMKWLSSSMKKADSSTSAEMQKKTSANIYTKEDNKIIKTINKRVQCSVDKKTDVITIEVTDQDPLVATQIADSVRIRLQKFITDYRTQKAREELAYVTELHAKAKAEYVESQRRYARFSDQNHDLVSNYFKAESDNLENEMQICFNSYQQVSAQLQLAKAKVMERTPAFTILKPAVVPERPYSPKRFVILVMVVFLTFIGTLCYYKFV